MHAGRLIGNKWGVDSIGEYSFAFGHNVNGHNENVSGYAGATFWAGNCVGNYGFATGRGNIALAGDAVAFGELNRISGCGGSFVVGENNISKSYALTVVGRFNAATGMNNAATAN